MILVFWLFLLIDKTPQIIKSSIETLLSVDNKVKYWDFHYKMTYRLSAFFCRIRYIVSTIDLFVKHNWNFCFLTPKDFSSLLGSFYPVFSWMSSAPMLTRHQTVPDDSEWTSQAAGRRYLQSSLMRELLWITIRITNVTGLKLLAHLCQTKTHLDQELWEYLP